MEKDSTQAQRLRELLDNTLEQVREREAKEKQQRDEEMRQAWQQRVREDSFDLLGRIATHLPELVGVLKLDLDALSVLSKPCGNTVGPHVELRLPGFPGMALRIGAWRDGQPLTLSITCFCCGEEIHRAISNLENLSRRVAEGTPAHPCGRQEDDHERD